ncbi:MAG: GNAT family N-acetyltransferase [Planctomycetota bacterium]|jgi:ribosomal protein S18 acetylase RimI-like enzyme
MNHQSVILRPAKPNFDEGLMYARYLNEASEGFFRFMLGRHVSEIIAAAYIQPGHDLSYQNAVFAIQSESIVGMASGYTARQRRRFSEQPLKKAARKRTARLRLIRMLFAPLWRILHNLAEDEFYLLAIAVDKELRGKGVGFILMNSIEDRARAAGSKRLSLDVSAGNKSAHRFYERLGMTIESGWPDFLFIPRLFVRMTKSLQTL